MMSKPIRDAKQHIELRGYVFIEVRREYNAADDLNYYRLRFRTRPDSPIYNYTWHGGDFDPDHFDNWDADHANLPEDVPR